MTNSRLYHEKYRPQFHFTSKKNWLNDPNGLVYYQGEYHLFFQHNPSGNDWGNMTWGHAVSPDLVHWTQLEDALHPDSMGTVFSGSAVVDWEDSAGFQQGTEPSLAALYTAAGGTSPESAGRAFTQCLAYSRDAGRTWTRYGYNPVVPHLEAENRDPKVTWHPGSRRWIMALYLEGHRFELLGSADLKSWTRLQTLDVPGCDECPDFFPMKVHGEAGPEWWVFVAADGRYLVGRFDGERFIPEGSLRQVEYGANCYAVQTYSDAPEGRRIQVGWMRGGRYPGMPFNQQMSFPSELTLHRGPGGLQLRKQPIREITLLHDRHREWKDLEIRPGSHALEVPAGEGLQIQAVVELQGAREFGLVIQGEEVRYDAANQKLSAIGSVAPLPLEDGRLRLELLVDRTSVETFANGGQATLSCCYLPPDGDLGVNLFAEGGPVRLHTLRLTGLRSAWRAG